MFCLLQHSLKTLYLFSKQCEHAETYLTVLGKIDLQSLTVVLKAERRHCEQDILSIHRLSLLLVTFLGGFAKLASLFYSRAAVYTR